MKKTLSIFTLIILVFATSCKSKEASEDIKNNPGNIPSPPLNSVNVGDIPLVDCIKKAIYYINEVDVATYDSISTQYFHQVIDYTDSIAIETEQELEKLTYILEVDGTQHYSNEQLDSIITKAHSLKTELTYFKKSVIGYVFVHTFLNKQDTMSAIIIANADRSKSEAIKIKTITDIEPNYFKQKIRNIEK
jgi:hypothetical protein